MTKKTSNQQTSLGRTLFQAIIAIFVVIAGLLFAGQGGSPSSTTTSPGTTDNTGSSQLPVNSSKPSPVVKSFDGCPAEGDGGDPVLNRNKNRIDDGNYQSVAFSALMPPNLTWPADIERRAHATWSQSDANQIGQAEGSPVSVVGYLALARKEGPETPNCHSTTDVDYHIWLIDHPGGSNDRAGSMVVEATPRVRVNHPGWTVAALNKLATSGTQVLISGWLMMDYEHPEQLNMTRGTLWEIHPIMEIDVAQNGQWVSLDNYSG